MYIKTHLGNALSQLPTVSIWKSLSVCPLISPDIPDIPWYPWQELYRSQRGSQDDGSLVLPDFPEDKEERDRSGEAHQDVGEEVQDGGGDRPQLGRVRPLQLNTRFRTLDS